MTDLATGRERLLCLAGAGVDIKIDDAGTGFVRFSYVQELPVSTLKIDKIFIDMLRAQGNAKRPVLDAIILFARESGLSTIAEGLETDEQVGYLVKTGVHSLQGLCIFAAHARGKWVKEHEMENGGMNTASR